MFFLLDGKPNPFVRPALSNKNGVASENGTEQSIWTTPTPKVMSNPFLHHGFSEKSNVNSKSNIEQGVLKNITELSDQISEMHNTFSARLQVLEKTVTAQFENYQVNFERGLTRMSSELFQNSCNIQKNISDLVDDIAKVNMKIGEVEKTMDSECVRISKLKHSDFVTVISHKFEDVADVFADILRRETEMLGLLTQDISDDLPELLNGFSENHPGDMLNVVCGSSERMMPNSVNSEYHTGNMPTASDIKKSNSMLKPVYSKSMLSNRHQAESSDTCRSDISAQLEQSDHLQAVAERFGGFADTFVGILKNESDMIGIGFLKTDSVERPPNLLDTKVPDSSENVASEEYRGYSSNVRPQVKDQASSEVRRLSDPQHNDMMNMMSKLSDISEKVSEHRIFGPSHTSEKLSEHRISEPRDISEKMSGHRISEDCPTNDSDHLGSERLISESRRAHVGPEQLVSESCRADVGPERLVSESCRADIGPERLVSESCRADVAVQLASEGLTAEHGISKSRTADGSKQHTSDEYQVDYSEI